MGRPSGGLGSDIVRNAFLFTLLLTNCLFFHDPDASSSGPGGAASSTGASNSGAAGGVGGQGAQGSATDTSATGAMANGGNGGEGGCETQTDPQNCGACGWDCGPGVDECVDGVCGAYSVDIPAVVHGVAAIGDKVVIEAAPSSGPLHVGALEIRAEDFVDGSNVLARDISEFEDGIGIIGRTGSLGGSFLYAPQIPVSPSVLACGLVVVGAECASKNMVGAVDVVGGHVNGLVADQGSLYVLHSGTLRLGRTTLGACAADSCTVTAASGEMSPPNDPPPATRVPVGLDLQVIGGKKFLWWSTYANGELACLHRHPTEGLSGAEVPCVVEHPSISRVTVAGSNVFFGTGTSGPIRRVWGADFEHGPLIGVGEQASYPADTDETMLYASVVETSNAHGLIALEPESSTGGEVIERGRVQIPTNEAITSIDASNEAFVFFTTHFAGNSKLYRWRKPYTAAPSEVD